MDEKLLLLHFGRNLVGKTKYDKHLPEQTFILFSLNLTKNDQKLKIDGFYANLSFEKKMQINLIN